MDTPDVIDQLASGAISPDDLPSAGGGDYCSAWDAGDGWLLLVARTDEASRSLARANTILATLVPRLSIPIPTPGGSGSLPDGRGFLLVRHLPGIPLTAKILGEMTIAQRAAAAQAIATFISELHATPIELAMAASIPVGWYLFAATEDAMRDGPAAGHYSDDLAALERTALLDADTLNRLGSAVSAHLERSETRPVLLHGEVSADHVFVDPLTLHVTGIIDFQGVVIGDPVRDLMYIADSYGEAFVDDVLCHYIGDSLSDPKPALAFYKLWHLVGRLLWSAEHGYRDRAETLSRLLITASLSFGR